MQQVPRICPDLVKEIHVVVVLESDLVVHEEANGNVDVDVVLGEEDLVDHVHNAIAGGHVGQSHGGLADRHGAVLGDSDLQLVSGGGLDRLSVDESGRVPSQGDDVAEHEGAQGGQVLAQVDDEVGVQLLKATKVGVEGTNQLLYAVRTYECMPSIMAT